MTVTTDSTVDVGTINPADLAALRAADSVSFHHFDGKSLIRPYVRGYRSGFVWSRREQLLFPDVFPGNERARDIAVDSHIRGYDYVAGSGTGWTSDTRPRAVGFAMVTANASSTWATVARILRPGDRLSLSWLADNNTDSIRSVGYHADELFLHVAPRTANANPMRFLIAHAVGPDNSARMVRRDG